jgi:hypothetical protein
MPDSPATPTIDDCRISGSVTSYRLVDVGYGIDLDRVAALMGDQSRERVRPSRAHAELIEIRNPPVLARLGNRRIDVGRGLVDVEIFAHLFDFGVCSIRLRASAPDDLSWAQFVEFGRTFDRSAAVAAAVEEELRALVTRITPAIDRPATSEIAEDYTVFRIDRVAGADGRAMSLSGLERSDLIALLSPEQHPISPEVQAELLSRRFSYFADDLIIVTWDNALVVETDRSDQDVEYVLEFANAQLLELRVYDAMLDAQLPVLYDRIEARRKRPIPTRRYRPLLAELQTTVADIVEIVERADNGFKVVNDVYLARVYLGALEVFREQAWRRGIDRKLQIFRDTYSMLNAEAQSARGELLEIIIVLLFVADILIGFLH